MGTSYEHRKIERSISGLMPAVWSSTTPISVLLSRSRRSCHPLEWSRKDPTERPCLAGERARMNTIMEQKHRYDLREDQAFMPGTFGRKDTYEHTPMCILPRLADGSRPLSLTKSHANLRAEQSIAANSYWSGSSCRALRPSACRSTPELSVSVRPDRPISAPRVSAVIGQPIHSEMQLKVKERPSSSPSKVRHSKMHSRRC